MNIDGKKIAAKRKDELKQKIDLLKENGQRLPKLTVVLVGENPASQTYVRNKDKACAYVGMLSDIVKLDEQTTEEKLIEVIQKLNHDDTVDGILVQLPLPQHIHEDKILHLIDPQKDVDGFHNQNMGALTTGNEGFISCTPAGIIELLKRSDITIAGKNCVVVGRSNIVGKPMALLLLKENGTVTICHSHTQNLKEM